MRGLACSIPALVRARCSAPGHAIFGINDVGGRRVFPGKAQLDPVRRPIPSRRRE
ncbi:MAG: hypothetical protein Q7V06_08515 [Methanocalculus sp.]|nr:hypothetical protein [Methanocalculus sp.]